jgi:hypothetical protein
MDIKASIGKPEPLHANCLQVSEHRHRKDKIARPALTSAWKAVSSRLEEKKRSGYGEPHASHAPLKSDMVKWAKVLSRPELALLITNCCDRLTGENRMWTSHDKSKWFQGAEWCTGKSEALLSRSQNEHGKELLQSISILK